MEVNSKILNFDLLFPIDPTLRECKYLYRCGNNKDDVERYFFVPDDFPLFYPDFILNEETKTIFQKTKNSFTLTLQYNEDALPEYQDMEKPVIIQRKYYQITRSDIRTFHLKLFYATFYHTLTHENMYDIEFYEKFCREYVGPDMNENNVEYCKLAVESQIYQYHGSTTNAQIRCNYEIISQFNEDDLDRFDQFVLDNE